MSLSMVTLLGGIHGVSTYRVFHLLFNDNKTVGLIFIIGVALYAFYRYMNRH
ncbi:hypothetical protein [Levilactobacillus bambusae]|uniref:hypothetical protein n=1 Tax=Levilactobacillus bambusae TaxID=2024736 RepID=UPI0014023A80|nr:hypothetical protein [Levilactobacillus bambusae]